MPSLTTRRVAPRLASSVCLFLLLTSAANRPARAQDLDDITIGGRVTDGNGAAVVGAKIVATRAATGASRAVATDAEGRYRLVELAPGTYTVLASSEGFAVEERKGLAAVAGQSVRLDFALRPAGVAARQTVTAEAGAPAVDTARTVTGGTLTRREIEELPVFARSPLDLVFTLPGVTEEPLSVRDAAEDADANSRSAARRSSTPEEAGTFALAGGAAYSNNLTVDGLDNNDDRSARERFQPSLEAVEEVQVVTNQFSAEYGRASGGRVNLRTRAGSNQFHGRAFYFFRDESLDANTFFNNARGLARLPLQQHDPGFTLGGRVIPKRTFFFTSYEYDTTLDSTVIDTLVPVGSNPLFTLPQPTTPAGRRTERPSTAANAPADLAPFVAGVSTPRRSHALTARVDHNFTETHNGAWLYQFGRLKNLRQFGGGSRLAESLQGRTRDTDALAYTDNFVLGARAVNQLRAQVSRLAPALKTDAAPSLRPVVLVTINDPLSPDDPSNRSGTLVAGSANAGASDRRESRAQLQETLTVLRGAHTLKVGGDFQLIRSTFVDLTDATGTYSFTSAGDFLANAPARFRQRFQTESRQRNLYTGVFVQDEWRVRPNLVLSFGLRHDDETVVRDRNNFAPRLAAAYDPTGAGKTVVRLGAGVFFNRALLRTVDDFTLGRNRLVFDTNDLRDAATGRALTDTQRRAFISSHLRFPETLDADSALVRQFAALQTDF
jgi:hypothetical protein